jgi:hypothetical protein
MAGPFLARPAGPVVTAEGGVVQLFLIPVEGQLYVVGDSELELCVLNFPGAACGCTAEPEQVWVTRADWRFNSGPASAEPINPPPGFERLPLQPL